VLFSGAGLFDEFPSRLHGTDNVEFPANIVVAQTLKDIPTAKIRASNDLNTKVRKVLIASTLSTRRRRLGM
jgi:hypothetical protein